MSQNSIYMDHAATTPIDNRVLLAMEPYWRENFHNPSSLYSAARLAKTGLEEARASVADVLGAKTSEIIFTAGATESINMAIQGVARSFPGKHIVTTAIEHDAVLNTVRALENAGFKATVVPVLPSGLLDPEAVLAAIRPDTILVSVMYANNEIGSILPIAKIAQGLEKLRKGRQLPLYLHTDAAQAGEYLDLHVSRLGVDLMSLNGSKIYGPKQTGILYVRTGSLVEPLIYGGGQEKGRRSGTENVAGAIGFSEALKLAQNNRVSEAKRLMPMRDELIGMLRGSIPDAILNGSIEHRLPNNINFTIPGAEGEAMVLYLDKAGILAGTGSACSTGSLDPSHVLLAIGRSKNQANCSLRLTLGRGTDSNAIRQLAQVLPSIVTRLREIA